MKRVNRENHIDSSRHRYACHSSLRKGKEGSLPSFRQRQREGGPAQRRPGESTVFIIGIFISPLRRRGLGKAQIYLLDFAIMVALFCQYLLLKLEAPIKISKKQQKNMKNMRRKTRLGRRSKKQ
jgi:hypothetical protein